MIEDERNEKNGKAAETERSGSGENFSEKQKKKRKVGAGRIILRVFACFFAFCFLALAGVELSTQISDKTWEQWKPSYEKADLTEILSKEQSALTEEDYAVIYAQTGLTKIGADRLIEKGKKSKISSIQQSYFANVSVTRERFAPWTCWEKLEDGERAEIGDVRAGDIIVTSATHVLGFRYGHAALVVSDGGTILEANTPGTKSHLTNVNTFDDYATFMVLRPDPEKISDETRLAVAEYARNELVEIPYTVFAGIFRKKFQQPLQGTQCAHIVWYAYKNFGIDLDGNGGCIVKPQDMANSEYMQIVQIYGFDPEKVWT
ncbi:MAG: hypothetical protein SPH68_03775 [Candidatus Borkfalkiaceae bacterium]|nr:hypothetical protein [Clostridia bacterium]MDY6223264.1 hypothetical protein [Christensenellaceae bacterium]